MVLRTKYIIVLVRGGGRTILRTSARMGSCRKPERHEDFPMCPTEQICLSNARSLLARRIFRNQRSTNLGNLRGRELKRYEELMGAIREPYQSGGLRREKSGDREYIIIITIITIIIYFIYFMYD